MTDQQSRIVSERLRADGLKQFNLRLGRKRGPTEEARRKKVLEVRDQLEDEMRSEFRRAKLRRDLRHSLEMEP